MHKPYSCPIFLREFAVTLKYTGHELNGSSLAQFLMYEFILVTACVKSLRACVGDWILHCEDCEVFLLSHDRWWVVHAKYGALKHSFDAALKWCVWLYICCVNIEVNPNFLKWTLFFLQSLDCVETDALRTDILYAAYLKTDLRDWRLRLIYCRLISETEYWDWYVQMLYAIYC